MDSRILVAALALACAPAAFAGETAAQAMGQMRTDAAVMQNIANTWPQIQQQAMNYGQFAGYGDRLWSGEGPTVVNRMGGTELCHNTHWDSATDNLVTGGLNIAGDAEAEAYALEFVSEDFLAQLGDYMNAQAQAGVQPQNLQQVEQQANAMEMASNNLNGLLNTVGNQISAALGTGSTLEPLPIQNWQAGIGNIPNLSAVQYIPGPSNGAPIGWVIPPVRGFARLEDICPTGTATIPMLPFQAPVLNAVQVTIQENPELAQNIQGLETPSTYAIPNGYLRTDGWLPVPNYAIRMSVVGVLGHDLPAIANYMAPIDSGLARYNQDVQAILGELQ
jgi:hypothetical protein